MAVEMLKSAVLTEAAAWMDKARCKGIDPDLFHPDENDEDQVKVAKKEKAKAICAECPVRLDCLEFAINKPEKDGIWGGATKDERDKLKRKSVKRNKPIRELAIQLIRKS